MFAAINSQDLDIMLSDFSDEVKEKIYKKFPYDKWKEFCNKFKGKCVCVELFGKELEITSNDKKMMILNTYDNSLGEFIFNWIDSEKEIKVQCTSSNCYSSKNYKVDLNFDEFKDKTYEATKAFDELKTTMEYKENKRMKGFNFDFGPCTHDNVRMSMYGLAVQNSAGVWVSYNNGSIVDVDILNFDGRQYMFKMPVAIKDIKVGDIVIHNRVPMFVISVEDGVVAVDVCAGEEKKIIPTTNMFGFNFVTKIVSMFDAMGNAPTADAPFGNMLPFLMMGDSKDIDPIMMFMMMNQSDGGFDMSNPMMMYFMFKDGEKDNDILPLMMMMNMQNKNVCNCSNHNEN